MQTQSHFEYTGNTQIDLTNLSKNHRFIDMPDNFCLESRGQEGYNRYIDWEVLEMQQDNEIFDLDLVS